MGLFKKPPPKEDTTEEELRALVQKGVCASLEIVVRQTVEILRQCATLEEAEQEVLKQWQRNEQSLCNPKEGVELTNFP